LKAIITGATGFVGRLLARRLPSASHLSIGSEGWRAAIAAADFDSATVFHLSRREFGAAATTFVLLAMATTVARARHRIGSSITSRS